MTAAIWSASLVLAVAGCTPDADSHESIGGKREWSVLQALELETREQKASHLEVRMVDEYVVLGVPRDGDSRFIWVLLNPSNPPFYKQIPNGNFWLDQTDLDKLVHHGTVSPTVEHALRSHVRIQ